MKESSEEEFQSVKNIFGGSVRWILVSIYAFFLKKEKPKRTTYTVPEDIEVDYQKHIDTHFKNGIAFIITLFIILSFLFILKNILF